MQEINELSLQRLKLVHDFVNCQQTLAQRLNVATADYCKAKTIHGFTLSSVAQPHEEMELVPSVRIVVDKKSFRLQQQEEEESSSSQVKKRNKPTKKDQKNDKEDKKDDKKEDKKDDKKEDKKEDSDTSTKQKKVGQFRPFGILEPSPAKTARKEMAQVMETVCELASIRAGIEEIDNTMERLIQSFKKDEELSALLSSMKVSN